jgi:hypothetical protein
MTGEGFGLAVLYRLVYGRACERLERYYASDTPEAVRAHPLDGLRVKPEVMADPEAAEVIAEAVDDAIARRRPRVIARRNHPWRPR